MDFVDWCGVVLDAFVADSKESATARAKGIGPADLMPRLFGGEVVGWSLERGSTRWAAVAGAARTLMNAGRINPVYGPHLLPTERWRLTDRGRGGAERLALSWRVVCEQDLDERQAELLRIVNRLSHREATDHAWLDPAHRGDILDALIWDDAEGWLEALARELQDTGLVSAWLQAAGEPVLYATYDGIVRETRWDEAKASWFLAPLVAKWETTNVEFKRELRFKSSKDQKAEFVKDILGLANTQVSGDRWLIVGFDDETHRYYLPHDLAERQAHLGRLDRLTPETVDQVLSVYTDPPVRVAFSRVRFTDGPVIVLGIERDPRHVPYRVRKVLVGPTKRIDVGQVFVRHGRITEGPTAAELDALNEEASQSRARASV